MEAMLQSWKDKAKKLSRFFSFRSLSLDRSQLYLLGLVSVALSLASLLRLVSLKAEIFWFCGEMPRILKARSYSKKSKSSSSTDTSIRSSPILKAFTSQNSISDNKSINSTLPNNESDFSTKCDNKEAISASENSILDTTDQLNVKKPTPYLTEDSSLISGDLYEFLLSSLPNIVKGCQWTLLYSTVKHGISLRTLIRRSADLSGPCLLIVGDKQGAIFGGLLECPLRPTPKRKYQGTNQTSVFTTVNGEPRLFRPTGANRYFYMCLNDLLALGGGNFALCLDEDLLCGTSGACETFGNQCLAHSSEFEVKNVELWGFTHSSRYLT